MATLAERRKQMVMDALDRFERPLLQYVQRLLGHDESQARDVVQHAFLKLCEQDPAETATKLPAWLYTVCRNRVLDMARKRSNERQAETDQVGNLDGREMDPANRMETTEMFLMVQRLVDQLPASEREVIELWTQGFSNREIASIAGKSDGAVRVSLHRAIGKLKQRPQIQLWLGNDSLDRRPVQHG